MKRYYRRRSHDRLSRQKEQRRGQNFFGNIPPPTFFQPVARRKCDKCEEEDNGLHRAAANTQEGGYSEKTGSYYNPIRYDSIALPAKSTNVPNKINFAHCNGVTVSGSTAANYSSTFSANGTPAPATDCAGCSGAQCITISGNVISIFRANPVITLPPVPGGLNACERVAVSSFINTTLLQHEQQHVAAFNTYVGTVTTPFSFTGCQSELNAYIQNIHNGIEAPRRAASNAQSDLLDANGANRFAITCNCPDPEPDAGSGKK